MGLPAATAREPLHPKPHPHVRAVVELEAGSCGVGVAPKRVEEEWVFGTVEVGPLWDDHSLQCDLGGAMGVAPGGSLHEQKEEEILEVVVETEP